MTQKVRDLMTGPPVAVRPDQSIAHAAQSMRTHDVGDLVVIADKTLRGLITDRDIVVRAVAEGREPHTTPVGDVCSEDLVTVGPDDDADAAVRTMRDYSVRRVPVVADGRCVGVLSLGAMAIERDERSALADISAARGNA